MTKIRITKANGRVTKLSISGHSGYAKSGEDIVCASISVLSQAAVNSMILALNGRDDFFHIDEKNGELRLNVPDEVTDVQRIRIDTLTQMLEVNFVDLQEQYKKNISLTVEEV